MPEVFEIQATIECRFTLILVRKIIITSLDFIVSSPLS